MSQTTQLALKKVKLYLLDERDLWKEILTGYLSISERQAKKILTLVVQSEVNQGNELQLPIQFLQNEEGKNVIIPEQNIKTIEKPEEQIIYIQIGRQGQTVSLSFVDRNYCDLIWDQLTLLRETREIGEDEKTWTIESFPFWLAELKNNNVAYNYVDFLFSSKDKIQEFCELFCSLKKQNSCTTNEFFFLIIKIVFLRGQINILKLLLQVQFFETILDILSLNPFNDQQYSYWQKYLEMTKIKNHLHIEDLAILDAYNCNARARFVKECAICMFSEPMTDLALTKIIAENNIIIIQRFIEDPINMQVLESLSICDPQAFLVTFTQIIFILKSLTEDYQTKTLKDNLYYLIVKTKLNSLSIKVAGQITGKEVPAIVFENWLRAISYLASYNWNQAQQWLIQIVPESTFETPSQTVWDYSVRNILKPANKPLSKEKSDKPANVLFDKESQNEQKFHLMKTLTAIMRQKQFSIKHSVLSFPTDIHNHISSRLKWFVFEQFIMNCFQICNTKDHLQNYLDFMVDIYEIEPIRARKVLVECEVLPKISSMFKDKYVLIMALKLLKIMVQKEDEDTFVYLTHKRVFHDIKKYYIRNKKNRNVMNSTFLSIFKAVEKCQKQTTRKYISKIFFPQEQNQISSFQSDQIIGDSRRNSSGIVVQETLKIKTKMMIQFDEQEMSKDRIIDQSLKSQEVNQIS